MKIKLTKNVLLIACLAWVSLAPDLDASQEPIPTTIRAVNVFSGVPQPSDDGNERTGGFGDVAANVVAATELKKRHPELTVRLLVTSSSNRLEPKVPTTLEIIKVMIPELDSSLKGQPQVFQGVEVIFLDFDFGPALIETKPSKLRDLTETMLGTLTKQVPPADVNLNFSHYEGAHRILSVNAPLAIGIEEHYSEKKLINYVISGSADFVELGSGPFDLGFLLRKTGTDTARTADANLELIKNWAKGAGIEWSGSPPTLLFAYTAEWQATQVYIDAITADPPNGNVLLFVKAFPSLDLSGLPANVKAVQFKTMPHEVMSALIHASALSPLVTGDISWSHAIGSDDPTKTFVYEAPWWKADVAVAMQRMLETETGLNEGDLDAMFLFSERLAKMDRAGLRQAGVSLARVLRNRPLQERIHQTLRNHRDEWDLVDNVFNIAGRLLQLLEGGAPDRPEGGNRIRSDRLQKIAHRIYRRLGTDAKKQEAQATTRKLKCKKAFDPNLGEAP